MVARIIAPNTIIPSTHPVILSTHSVILSEAKDLSQHHVIIIVFPFLKPSSLLRRALLKEAVPFLE